MSTSSIAAAKRRRAGNVVASPLFKSNNATSNIEPGQRRVNRVTENLQNEAVRQLHNPNSVPETQSESVDFKKPMSLQQVITVFDKRLLVLEKAIIDNKIEVPATPSTPSTPINSVNSVNNELNTKMIETLREDFKITVTEQASEFDYRTQMIAEEITNLKEIVMKLQSYTLDVNKMLMEERMQMFSDTMDHIQIQSDEVLNEDDLAIIDNTETSTNISMELVHDTDNINDDETIESNIQETLQKEEEVQLENQDNNMEESTQELTETENQDNNMEESTQGERNEEENIEDDEELIETEDVVAEESIPGKKPRKKRKDKKTTSIDL
jgi:hypothetical protein